LIACGRKTSGSAQIEQLPAIAEKGTSAEKVIVGANRTSIYIPMLKGKKVGVVANQTSVIFKENSSSSAAPQAYTHLVDSLLSSGIAVLKVFAPEHGFRGMADAGEEVSDGVDKRTGLPIISLYGENRKPTASQLQDLEVVVFDIQDVGVRFYTYIATLQLVMEACAAAEIPVLVLDRPNPNGHYIDGPTMKTELTSFLGMTTIPLVYGMTIGEYATMINEEGWLEGRIKADLTVIHLENYTHRSSYSLPIRPSPNLPNDKAINLYPSLGLFEGTNVNAGRGTEFQFQRYGASFLDSTYFTFSYTPKPNIGAKSPKQLDVKCFGEDLSTVSEVSEVSLQWLIKAYEHCLQKDRFFNTNGFSKHAGTEELQQQIERGLSEAEIRKTWQSDITNFSKIRAKYLAYH
jgi:uncharacterized protein YbbC (DUF1343 family)